MCHFLIDFTINSLQDSTVHQSTLKSFMNAIPIVDTDYKNGYCRGLRRHYHGDQYGSEDEHQKWLILKSQSQELGDGYRDGFAGIPPLGFNGNLENLS